MQVLADEWGDRGRVYSVNPGGTATPMRAAAMPDEDPSTIPSPEDVVPLFLHLAEPSCTYPTGSTIRCPGLPGLASPVPEPQCRWPGVSGAWRGCSGVGWRRGLRLRTVIGAGTRLLPAAAPVLFDRGRANLAS